jgi:hypothetical protein
MSSSGQRARAGKPLDQRRGVADAYGRLLSHSKLVWPQCAPLKINFTSGSDPDPSTPRDRQLGWVRSPAQVNDG